MKIDEVSRMHFYTAELPAIVDEGIHNHRYDFKSTILKGEFEQQLYQAVDGDDYIREYESCKEGVEAVQPGVPCGIFWTGTHHYQAGSSYSLNSKTFHEVYAKWCVTLVERASPVHQYAEVIRPKGSPKVCPFSQKVEEARLWAIVEEMLR